MERPLSDVTIEFTERDTGRGILSLQNWNSVVAISVGGLFLGEIQFEQHGPSGLPIGQGFR